MAWSTVLTSWPDRNCGTLGCPVETRTATVDPLSTRLPAPGSVPTTPPTGTVSEALLRIVVEKPSFCNSAVAVAVFMPAIAGTDE